MTAIHDSFLLLENGDIEAEETVTKLFNSTSAFLVYKRIRMITYVKQSDTDTRELCPALPGVVAFSYNTEENVFRVSAAHNALPIMVYHFRCVTFLPMRLASTLS